MAHEHVNHVRFFKGDDANMSSGTTLYTPPTGKVLDVKQIIISFTGDALCVVNIYNDTDGTSDEVMAFNYAFNADDNQNQTIHLTLLHIYHI